MESSAIVVDPEQPETRIKLLNEISGGIQVDGNIQIKFYFNSGRELLRMAEVCLRERNYERAYVLYMRYMTLFLERIREHPQYKAADAAQKLSVHQKCKEIFPIAEELKNKLRTKYEEEYRAVLERRELQRQKEVEEEARRAEERRQEYQKSLEEKLNERIQTKLIELEELSPAQDNSKLYPSHSIQDQSVTKIEENKDKPTSDPAPSPGIPRVDRSTKPSSLFSLLGGGEALRKVIVPNGLTSKFLELARSNTAKNIETCGILAGQFCANRFTISHVLIPPQRGTSDSCLTENEETLFLYQDKYGLITLGWIHTHPSQSSFMSSIDLHTHCSYQLMLPEAIAIVCAPKHGQIGVFSLTNDYGVDYIARCQATGFHPHPTSPPIYEESKHVIFDDHAPVQIVDLRG